MVAIGQEMVSGKKNSSRSGKSLGISLRVRGILVFEFSCQCNLVF